MSSEPRARRARLIPIYDPRARHLRIFSAALGVEKGSYIFVPPELKRDAALRVPSLYLFRGHEREWINPVEDSTRGGRTVIDTYLELRARNEIGPMILVFPGISSDDNHIPGLLVNCRAPELAQGRAGFGTGRFEDYLVQDLIPYIDSVFPTLPDGRHRGVGGFSLGGFMAFKIAAQHPRLFGSASAYDGTFLYASDGGRAVRPTDSVLRNPMFGAAWGDPRDLRFIAANSPANLILRGDATALSRITWMIQYGPQSREPWAANFYRGEHMLRVLRQKGLHNALPAAALADGDHTWRIADRHMATALPIHWNALRESPL